jgi:hypothetical protein
MYNSGSSTAKRSYSVLRGSSFKGIVLLMVLFAAPYLTPKQDNAQMRIISEENIFCVVLQFLKGCAINRRQRVAFSMERG